MARAIFLGVIILLNLKANAQTIDLVLTNETINKLSTDYFDVLKKERFLILLSQSDTSLIYYGEDNNYNGTAYEYITKGKNMLPIGKFSKIINDSFHGLSLNTSYNASFFSRFYLNDPIDYGYSTTHLFANDQEFSLDSIYNADKKIHSSFSSDGRYLLVNTLNTLSDYYNPEQDNRIMVYDLQNIKNGEIKKEYIPCTHCSDSYLIGDQLFFTVGRNDGYGGFSNKDIYVAPWGSLKDSVKIASNTEIKAISPDGKYILGTRFWDRQKNTAVIVDVESKKFQMLLGRDYAEKRAFYSHHENKFAFDFKGYLIYLNFPQSYPFDALKWRNEEIPDWTEEEFWAKYEHAPLDDE